MAHSSIKGHRKLKRLQRELDVPAPAALGYLEFLWLAVYADLSIRDDGLLSGWTADDIGLVAEWPGDSAVFVAALVSAGFLDKTDEGLAIHDYADWAPNYVKDRWRKRRMRTSASTPRKRCGYPSKIVSDGPNHVADSPGHSARTQGNETMGNRNRSIGNGRGTARAASKNDKFRKVRWTRIPSDRSEDN